MEEDRPYTKQTYTKQRLEELYQFQTKQTSELEKLPRIKRGIM